MTYVCSPNNPTGSCASRARLEYLLGHASGVVILDEAYAEFAGESLIGRAAQSPGLLVVRTLSKAFGLAGLRVGYAVGSPALVAEVEKSRGPYKVSAIAEEAAVCALESDRAWVKEKVAEVIASRERFSAELRLLGLIPLRSDSNFVLVPLANANDIAARMRSLGVALRPFASLPAIGDALRISIGPWSMMEEALAALEECIR